MKEKTDTDRDRNIYSNRALHRSNLGTNDDVILLVLEETSPQTSPTRLI